MIDAIRRTLRPVAHWILARQYAGGGSGWRWDPVAKMTAPVSAAIQAHRPLAQRAAYQVANNPWAARLVDILETNVIGDGIRPRCRVESEPTRKRVQTAFDGWARMADADGRATFYGIQEQAARSLFVNGEAFIKLEADAQARALRLRLLDPGQVDSTYHADLGGGRQILAGVEFQGNRRVAYHVFDATPGDVLALPQRRHRIPAADMLHIFKPAAPGAVRGVSRFAPILARLADQADLEDAQLMRQKTAALFTGFIRNMDGSGAPFDGGAQLGGVLEASLEPGAMRVLPPGVEVEFSNPARVGDGADFLKSQLRAIAAGAGVTYEQLTGDMGQTNYSSARVALLEFERLISSLQRNVIIPQMCAPVWRRWIGLATLAGQIPQADPDAVTWTVPARPWIDPLKDGQAAALAQEKGFRSRAEIVAQRGRDLDELAAEIAADPVAPLIEKEIPDE